MAEATANPRMHPGTGLEGVSIGPSEIGLVDGENGRLIYRGHDAEVLVRENCFEEVAYLLWTGELPSIAERDALRATVFENMRLVAHNAAIVGQLDPQALPMDAVRSARSAWAQSRNMDEGGTAADAQAALGAIAGAVALLGARRAGVEPGEIRADDSVARAYLRLMRGSEPTDAQVGALDAYLVLTAEHGMNASTFTGRVIVSTASDIGSGLVGAIGALKGKLHGGAPSHVSSMIDEIGTTENAEPWLRAKIEGGERLMGFGHRVYKTYDPRARALGEVAERLGSDDQRLALARHVEQTALRLLHEYKPDRRLYTNVEYYAAAVLETIDLDPGLYTPTFAVSRTAGWTAHMLEQIAYPRLIRPQVDYVGPMPKD
jgi:citrate synthase